MDKRTERGRRKEKSAPLEIGERRKKAAGCSEEAAARTNSWRRLHVNEGSTAAPLKNFWEEEK